MGRAVGNADGRDRGRLSGEDAAAGNLKERAILPPSLHAAASEVLVSMTTPFLGDSFTG